MLAQATLAVTLLALATGSVIRLTNASLACEDWPLCYGQVLPFSRIASIDIAALFALAHRFSSAAAALLIAVLAALAIARREARIVRGYAASALVLTLAQVLIGAVVVRTQLEPASRFIHALVGLAVTGLLSIIPLRLTWPDRLDGVSRSARALARGLVALASAVLLVLASGALTSINGAALACGVAWPLCNGSLLPNGGGLVFWQWAHRTLALLVVLYALLLTRQMLARGARIAPELRTALLGLLAAFGAQMVLGVLLVLLQRPALVAVAHHIAGALTWIAALRLAFLGGRLEVSLPERPARQPAGWRLVLSDYIALTKPKVVSLLLFTTLATMFVTPRGAPPWYLVFWTALAGYLMVGAANAYNMWFDRDIDAKMGRTALRPIPGGRISAARALAFSGVLLALSLTLFVLFVNIMAAAMALAGFVYYTVIYTSWLKRSTWQNIVIGGGAGAIPPLIGWAAATGQVTWTALLLFFIIYYWTPPHFWALAIMKKQDYANAGIPMLPVVATDRETTRQMLIYSLGMVALTLVLVPLGMMGTLYLAAAAVLGGLFVWYAWRALRAPSPKTIWGMYGFSLLYLALLFGAMVVDRLLV